MRLTSKEVEVLTRIFEKYYILTDSALSGRIDTRGWRVQVRELVEERNLIEQRYTEFSGDKPLSEAIKERTGLVPDIPTPDMIRPKPIVQQGPSEDQLLGLLREVNDTPSE